ncbi:hypothetical protein [Actinoplanes sp. NPDC049265]|uniref:hypothetical protein n=1 Tax=Actinoplanes sp. NPDC049265 TaxID=3363902 RepID=UPI00371C3810
MVVPPAPAPKNRLPLILGIVVGVFALCCGGGAVTLVVASTGGGPLASISLDQPGARASRTPPSDPDPAPSATPSATPAPSTPAAPATLPADEVYQGRGGKTVKLKPLSPDFGHYLVATHRGSSNFAVWAMDDDGVRRDLVINEVGRYEGSRPLGLEQIPSALKVEADGSWKITVRVLEKAPSWPRKTSGKGATVLRVDPSSAPGSAKVTHQGRSNFVVQTYGDSPDLLVNEIGKFSGDIDIAPGTRVIAIEGDGSWTMKPS